jgi:hypothetical protein
VNLDELRPILMGYRKQVEQAWSPATAHEGYEGRAGDPAGQCGVTSAWLQRRLLEDHGIETAYCIGTRSNGHHSARHCWLETGRVLDPVINDLTADQYGGDPVTCDFYSVLVLEHWFYYSTERRLDTEGLLADPVQARLAILTAALS